MSTFNTFRLRPTMVRVSWIWFDKFGPRGGLRKTPRPIHTTVKYLILQWADSNEIAIDAAIEKVGSRFNTTDEEWGGFYDVVAQEYHESDYIELDRWEE